jgi:predicted transcriptional regulator
LIPSLVMAMTLRLTDDEQEALRLRAAEEGVSMQELARRAVREYVGLANHRERIVASARRIMNAHADAIERLGR